MALDKIGQTVQKLERVDGNTHTHTQHGDVGNLVFLSFFKQNAPLLWTRVKHFLPALFDILVQHMDQWAR